MLLAVDIGNTNVDLGLYGKAGPSLHRKLPTRQLAEASALRQAVRAFLLDAETHAETIAVAAVVAGRAAHAVEALAPLGGDNCLCVDASWDLGLQVDYDSPQAVGIDRLLAAAAAHAAARSTAQAVIVADAGTALTVDAVSSGGIFRGGLIAPGLRLGLEALHRGTSLLPAVELSSDVALLGRSTRQCLQAGAVHGTASMLTELFARLAAHLGESTRVELTGGDAELLAPLLPRNVMVRPSLVLDGLWLAVQRRTSGSI